MGGRPSRKIFCMGMSKHSGKPCLAKGYPTGKFDKSGKNIFKCRFHGAGNCDQFGFKDRAGKGGFKKSGYDDESRITVLQKLKQFNNDRNKAEQYYYSKIKPRLDANNYTSERHLRSVNRLKANFRDILKGESLQDQFKAVLRSIEKARKFRDQN